VSQNPFGASCGPYHRGKSAIAGGHGRDMHLRGTCTQQYSHTMACCRSEELELSLLDSNRANSSVCDMD
jgi:hypothetical protein